MADPRGLYYWLPGNCGLDEWAAAGLTHAFGGKTPVMAKVSSLVGPGNGTVYHAESDSPTAQPLEWREVEPGGLQIGYAVGKRPGPDELSIGTVLPDNGWFAVKLEDGREWMVPRLVACRDRDPNRIIGVPCVFEAGAGGPVAKPSPQFREAVRLAEKIQAASFAQREVGTLNAIQAAAATLGVCYAVGVDEVLALGLLGHSSTWAVLAHACDLFEAVAAGVYGVPTEREVEAADLWNELGQAKRRLAELETAVV